MDIFPPSDEGRFGCDPFGYSAMAWHKWGAFSTINGFPVDITKPPTAIDLKNPVLWLTHAIALSTAANCLVDNDPEFDQLETDLKSISHSQYYAVALMLIGYSLEVCLKAMLLIKIGPEAYTAKEKSTFHHKLVELSSFVPNLSEKDHAILKCLTQFTTWAGRYPDPGSKRLSEAEEVFAISEAHEIAAKDLFDLSSRVMRHLQTVVG